MIYIAGPFFNEEQTTLVNNIKHLLEELELPFFSPKDECMFTPGVTTPEQVLNINIKALKNTDILVCITDGKDPGTMFEAGWAYAKDMPIIYVWFSGKPGQKFNLMLGASGSVVRSMKQLKEALLEYNEVGFIRKNWGEEMNYE